MNSRLLLTPPQIALRRLIGLIWQIGSTRCLTKNKKLTFSQAIGDELYGVTMADLWAGYINYSLKNKENLQQSKYILVKEYGDNQDEE